MKNMENLTPKSNQEDGWFEDLRVTNYRPDERTDYEKLKEQDYLVEKEKRGEETYEVAGLDGFQEAEGFFYVACLGCEEGIVDTRVDNDYCRDCLHWRV